MEEKQYFLVGSGESYQTRIAKESDLLDAVIDLIWGEISDDAPQDEIQFYKEALKDQDRWSSDPDFGNIRWSVDIGETDHIQIFLITSSDLRICVKERADAIVKDILINHFPRVKEGLETGYIDENQILVIYDHAVRARILREKS